MYKPTREELEVMGFTPQSWEGVIYRWDYGGLVYHTGDWVDEPHNDADKEQGWDVGSWWNGKLNITKREEVEFLQKILIIDPPEVYDDNE